MTDRELLDQLTRDRSEAAFTELLRRHIDLVHSAALRQLGDAEAARDLTQHVFIELARQAGRLHAEVILTGWLYRTTRHLCLETLRRDRRRREREHTAAAQLMNDATANPWEQVAPALEPAMDELGETDRQAILLRYFENQSLREVGVALGLGEDAAQKRVSRALDRLRDIFSRRGVSLSATALAGSLAAGAVQAAPAGLAVTISTAALGGAAVAAATTLATEGATTAMNLINLKTAAAILGAAAVTGTTTYLVQEREAEQWRADYQTLNETHGKLAAEQQKARELIQLRDEQISALKNRLPSEQPGERATLNELGGIWSLVESTNYTAYIENLRAIGCPELTIRDIIVSEINQLYAPRLKALQQPTKPWAYGHVGDPTIQKHQDQLDQIMREKSNVLKQLLGIDGYYESRLISGAVDHVDGLFEFLPYEKRERVRELMETYGRKEQEIYWKGGAISASFRPGRTRTSQTRAGCSHRSIAHAG